MNLVKNLLFPDLIRRRFVGKAGLSLLSGTSDGSRHGNRSSYKHVTGR
jgi:hypothetical protein